MSTTQAQRTIRVLYTQEGRKDTFITDIMTWEQLEDMLIEKAVDSGNSLNFSRKEVVVKETKNSLVSPDALLPQGDFTLYVYPKESKSGMISPATVKEALSSLNRDKLRQIVSDMNKVLPANERISPSGTKEEVLARVKSKLPKWTEIALDLLHKMGEVPLPTKKEVKKSDKNDNIVVKTREFFGKFQSLTVDLNIPVVGRLAEAIRFYAKTNLVIAAPNLFPAIVELINEEAKIELDLLKNGLSKTPAAVPSKEDLSPALGQVMDAVAAEAKAKEEAEQEAKMKAEEQAREEQEKREEEERAKRKAEEEELQRELDEANDARDRILGKLGRG